MWWDTIKDGLSVLSTIVTLAIPVFFFFFRPRLLSHEEADAKIGAAVAPLSGRLDTIEKKLEGVDAHQQEARRKALEPVLDQLSDIAEGVGALQTKQAVIEERIRAMPGQDLALQVASLSASVTHLVDGIRTVTGAVARHDDLFADAARRAGGKR